MDVWAGLGNFFTLNFTVFNNGPEVLGGCNRQTMRPDIFDSVIGRKKA